MQVSPLGTLLVTGANGQLGRAVVAEAQKRARPVHAVGGREMPLEDRDAIRSAFAAAKPSSVIHCAAATNVDGCEQDPLQAFRVNALGTAWVAETAASMGAALLYVSTDFVFDGEAVGRPYATHVPVRPLSVYGQSKRLGEEAVLAHGREDFWVVRTSWVFGPGGRNFPKAILDRARSGQPLKVVTDQVGRPTMTVDLAEALLDIVDRRPARGVYHAANEGQCSWHGFAVAILRAAAEHEPALAGIVVGEQSAADLQRPAPRPAWSVLDTSRLTETRGRPLPDYRDAVARWLALERAAAATSSSLPDPNRPLGGKQY